MSRVPKKITQVKLHDSDVFKVSVRKYLLKEFTEVDLDFLYYHCTKPHSEIDNEMLLLGYRVQRDLYVG